MTHPEPDSTDDAPLLIHPLISLGDKITIATIKNEVQKLNSSLLDIVDFLVKDNIHRGRTIKMSDGVDVEGLPLLSKVALQHAGQKKLEPLTNTLFQTMVLDVITDFIYDHIEGEKMAEISEDYRTFRRFSLQMEQEDPRYAPYWRHMFSKMIEPPSAGRWNDLAGQLTDEIYSRLQPFLSTWQEKKRRKCLARLHEPIEQAYKISMAMQGSVLSRSLLLQSGRKELSQWVNAQDVNIGQELKIIPGKIKELEGRQGCLVLGGRGLGLVGIHEGGNFVLLKPSVTVALVQN